MSAGDEAALAAHAEALAAAAEAALAGWVVRVVRQRMTQWAGDVPDAVDRAARAAGDDAVREVLPPLRELLHADVDAQPTNPLAVLRAARRYPTAVLRDAGVPPVARDGFQERNFPDDDYDVVPASFADIDPALHEPGLLWGAAKAHVVLARRRAEGRR